MRGLGDIMNILSDQNDFENVRFVGEYQIQGVRE